MRKLRKGFSRGKNQASENYRMRGLPVNSREITLQCKFSSSVEETETKESKGRLLLIIVKGDHIKEDGGKLHVYIYVD